jgi:tRNA A-37 threonylcarbamoyl transferase component Bud32
MVSIFDSSIAPLPFLGYDVRASGAGPFVSASTDDDDAVGSSLEDDSLLRKIAHVSEADVAPPVAALTTVEAPPSSQPVATRSEPPELPRVGAVIDQRYRVESVLGEGGMGVVYAARNLRTGRDVALKLMVSRDRLDRSQHPQRVERFVREARAAGRIQHPNVVDVYDVGGDDSAPYLVMERLHGRTLGALLGEGRLPERRAVQLVLAAAQGVAAAHRQGVVHRDLKPDNIFLTETASGELTKVLDFGISRIMTPSESLDSLTRSGTILGTPAYMPHEQLRGGEVDTRADVYALGVILYEALSGRRPFEAANLHDLVLKMAQDEPTPLARVAPAASVRVRSVVARCLARDPAHRYADAGALVEALERVLRDPDHTEDALPAQRAGRRRVAIVLGVVVAGSLAAWAAYVALRPAPEPVAPAAEAPVAAPRSEPAPAPLPVQPPLTAPTRAPEPAPSPATPSAPPARVRPAPRPRAEPAVQPEPGKDFERARELRPDDF